MSLFTNNQKRKFKMNCVREKNLDFEQLSLKYKRSLENMYDEHIFTISHEIRSPLAVINSCSLAQLNDLKLIFNLISNNTENILMIKNIKDRIKTIDEQVKIIESCIHNLTEYGRYVSSKNAEELKIIELQPYLNKIISTAPSFSRTMKVFSSISYACSPDFDGIHVPMNTNDLSRILINVFKNAGDAIYNSYDMLNKTKQNYKPSLKLRCIKTYKKNTAISLKPHVYGPFGKKRYASPFYLVIEDNGPGISSENKHKLFNTCFTTKENNSNFGMGLKISMDLALKNDLSLFFDTNDNGTKIIIGFPHLVTMESDIDNPSAGWVVESNAIIYSPDSAKLYDEIADYLVSIKLN